jgi:hypothetical protein
MKDWILRSFVMLGGLGAIVAFFNPRDLGRPHWPSWPEFLATFTWIALLWIFFDHVDLVRKIAESQERLARKL